MFWNGNADRRYSSEVKAHVVHQRLGPGEHDRRTPGGVPMDAASTAFRDALVNTEERLSLLVQGRSCEAMTLSGLRF